MFDQLLRESFVLIVVVSGLPLLASFLASLTVGILQAATQIQEQTLPHLVKCVAIAGVLLLCGGWFCSLLVRFFRETYDVFRYI